MPPHCDNQMLLHVVAFFFMYTYFSPIFHQSSMHPLQATLIPDLPLKKKKKNYDRFRDMWKARKLVNVIFFRSIGVE